MQFLQFQPRTVDSPCLLQAGTSCYQWNQSWSVHFLGRVVARWWPGRFGGLEVQEASFLGESAWVQGVW